MRANHRLKAGEMTTDELRMELTAVLERYEDSLRRYCDKVEKDRPWVASAMWQNCWTFRKGLLMQLMALDDAHAAAKRMKDPG